MAPPMSSTIRSADFNYAVDGILCRWTLSLTLSSPWVVICHITVVAEPEHKLIYTVTGLMEWLGYK